MISVRSHIAGRSPARLGFSLLEIMFAMSILAIVLASIVANMSSLNQARENAGAMQQADAVIRGIMEKLQAIDFDDLGDDDHWSAPRFLTSAAGETLEGLSAEELITANVIQGPLAFDDVDVYIEYYRGIDFGFDGAHLAANNAATPGMMQYEDEAEDEYLRRVNDRVLDEPTAFRLTDRAAITTIAGDPIIIRLLIIWEGRQRLILYTSRRQGGSI